MLGKKIIQLRREHDWTQQDLADRSGVSRNSIINCETEKRSPRTVDVEKLASVLGVSVQYLMDGETENISPAPREIKPVQESDSFAYWGGVLDKARKVIERGDKREISLIEHLLQSAVEMLKNSMTNENARKTNVSVYNGDNSHYQGNSFNMTAVI